MLMALEEKRPRFWAAEGEADAAEADATEGQAEEHAACNTEQQQWRVCAVLRV